MVEIDYTKYKYLFLDRDGVINVERPNDYVKSIAEIIFIEGAKEAIADLSKKFDKLFIITNQRGIKRGLYSHDDLEDIHKYMISEIEKEGGTIDKIYYCSDLRDSSINRKPNIGMGFQTKRDYPEVNFAESIFVGNSESDIIFGKKLDMLTVLVGDKYKEKDNIYSIINVYCENLHKFAEEVNKKTHNRI